MSTPHFQDPELVCPCSCGLLPTEDFQLWLEELRVRYGKPMVLSSAARCVAHNMAVGGGKLSAHVERVAVDVLIPSVQDAFELIDAAVIDGWTGIGVKQHGPRPKRFIHLDLAEATFDRPRPAIWSY